MYLTNEKKSLTENYKTDIFFFLQLHFNFLVSKLVEQLHPWLQLLELQKSQNQVKIAYSSALIFVLHWF